MKPFIQGFLVGALTSLMGYPIVDGGQFKLKNLLILLLFAAVAQSNLWNKKS